ITHIADADPSLVVLRDLRMKLAAVPTIDVGKYCNRHLRVRWREDDHVLLAHCGERLGPGRAPAPGGQIRLRVEIEDVAAHEELAVLAHVGDQPAHSHLVESRDRRVPEIQRLYAVQFRT